MSRHLSLADQVRRVLFFAEQARQGLAEYNKHEKEREVYMYGPGYTKFVSNYGWLEACLEEEMAPLREETAEDVQAMEVQLLKAFATHVFENTGLSDLLYVMYERIARLAQQRIAVFKLNGSEGLDGIRYVSVPYDAGQDEIWFTLRPKLQEEFGLEVMPINTGVIRLGNRLPILNISLHRV